MSFFEIGVFHGKSEENVGTLLRSAWQLGAAGVFTIGRRYSRQGSDTTNTTTRLPVRHHATFDEYVAALPFGCPIVAVEMGSHRSVWDGGYALPPEVLRRCHHHVSLPPSFNVAVAGSIVMFDRLRVRGAP